MSNRDEAIAILENIPDDKIGYVLSFLKGFQFSDDIDDDMFCQRLYQEYLDDSSPNKSESISIEDAAAMLGVSL